jgi:hypothetical protein
VVLSDDMLTLISSGKAGLHVSGIQRRIWYEGGMREEEGQGYRAKPTPRLFPMLSRRILLEMMLYPSNMPFRSLRLGQHHAGSWGKVGDVSGHTFSVNCFGRLER